MHIQSHLYNHAICYVNETVLYEPMRHVARILHLPGDGCPEPNRI